MPKEISVLIVKLGELSSEVWPQLVLRESLEVIPFAVVLAFLIYMATLVKKYISGIERYPMWVFLFVFSQIALYQVLVHLLTPEGEAILNLLRSIR